MASVFRRESRTVQRFVGLPGVEKARLWPTVAAILDQARADHQEISDQIVLGALNDALIKGIVAGHYFDVYESLGKVLGLAAAAGKSDAPAAVHTPGGKALPEREARPLTKAAAR